MTPLAASILVVAMLLAAAAPQQAPRDARTPLLRGGTAVLSGIVMTDETPSRPIRRAIVSVSGGDRMGLQAITNDDGRFTVRGLPPGRYVVAAGRPGFVTMTHGASRPGRAGTAIPVLEGQQITNITIRLPRGAVLAGTLTTDTGEPAVRAAVGVMMYMTAPWTGERQLVNVFVGGPSRQTDEFGAFRIYGLEPGEYVVAASSSSAGAGARQTTDAEYQRALQLLRAGPAAPIPPAPPESSPPMGSAVSYFPGTFSAQDARIIRLAAGEERTGIDFTVRRVPTSRLTGVITGADGLPAPNIAVTILGSERRGPGMGGLPLPRVTSDRDGRFSVNGLTPGPYTVVARAGGPTGGRGAAAAGAPNLWAKTDVVADGRDLSVSLALQPGATVSGRLVIDHSGAAARVDPPRVRVNLTAVLTGSETALGVPPATPDADGAFSFTGVTPGRYRVQASAPVGGTSSLWVVKSVTMGGRDMSSTPLEVAAGELALGGIEVTLTDRVSELSGSLLDGNNFPAPEFFLIAFPKDRALWSPESPRIQSVRPAADGKFVFRGLPAGDYLLGAVTDVQPGEMYSREFLAQLVSGAIPCTLGEGERKVQDIRVK